MQKTQQPTYGQQRLLSAGLAKHPQIQATKWGRIEISYTHLNGNLVYYTPNNNEKSIGIERHQRIFKRERLNPELLQDACQIAKGQRYTQAAKDFSGIGTLTFFPYQISDNYTAQNKLDVLVFTEGEIKAAIACQYQLPTIAFAGISVYQLCPETQDFLRTAQPKHIVIQYDSDCVEQKGWKRAASFYSSAYKFALEILDFIQTEQLNIQIHLCRGNGAGGKGLDDVLLAQAPAQRNKLVEQFKTLTTNAFFTFKSLRSETLSKDIAHFFGYCPNYYKLEKLTKTIYAQGGKFLDILRANNIKLNPKEFCNRAWVVPTGTGKSYTVIEFAKTYQTIMLCPTLGLCRDIANSAQKQGVDCILYQGEDKMPLIHRTNANQLPNMIVACYQSFDSLLRILGEFTSKYNLFIDEAHNFTTATSKDFCLREMQLILDNKAAFKTFTTLTGTHLYNFDSNLAKLRTIRVVLPNTIHKRVLFTHCTNITASAAQAVKTSLERGRTPIVLLNSKGERLDKFKDEVESLVPNKKFRAWNSTTKDCAEWQALLQTQHLPEGLDFFVTTSVLKEGNNVLNAIENIDIIVATPMHSIELAQFAARFRNAKNIDLYLLKGSKTEKEKSYFNPLSFYIQEEEKAANICKFLNDASLLSPDVYCTLYEKFNGDLHIRENGLQFWEVHELELSNSVFKKETNFLWANEATMLERLGEYGFEHYQLCADTSELSLLSQESAKTRKKKKAEKRDTDFQEALEALREAPHPRVFAEREIQNNTETNPFYQVFLDIAQHAKTLKLALDYFAQTKGKKKDITLLLQRLNFMYHHKAIQKDNTSLKKVIENLYGCIQIGIKYTPEQVRKLFLKCIAEDKNIDQYRYIKDKRNDAILKMLRLLFDAEKTKGVWTFKPLDLATKAPTELSANSVSDIFS